MLENCWLTTADVVISDHGKLQISKESHNLTFAWFAHWLQDMPKALSIGVDLPARKEET
jgi:hypothetical protein